MRISTRSVLITLVTALGLTVGAVTAASEPADAGPGRPLLSVPFECGEIWRGSAWTGHNPSRAIDFNLPSGKNTDLGEIIRTSGPGIVLSTRKYDGAGYGRTILIEHENGYQSFYAHLKLGSVRVEAGQRVRNATILARVGRSGRQRYAHLHYEQRHHGRVIPILLGTRLWVEYPSVENYKRGRRCG